jgi:hypothetical protein
MGWTIGALPATGAGHAMAAYGAVQAQCHHRVWHHFRRSSTSRPDWLKIAFNVPFLSSSWSGTEKTISPFKGQHGFLLAF